MPKSKRMVHADRYSNHRPLVNMTGVLAARGVGCVASEKCTGMPVPHAPVQLCGKHMREIYEFAQDFIAERWDESIREYVSDLHGKFAPPGAVKKRVRAGHVYFIRLGNRIKIGFSEDPKARLGALPHEEVIGIIRGTYEDEQTWHKLLADYRVAGEWFRADPEVLDALSRVAGRAS